MKIPLFSGTNVKQEQLIAEQFGATKPEWQESNPEYSNLSHLTSPYVSVKVIPGPSKLSKFFFFQHLEGLNVQSIGLLGSIIYFGHSVFDINGNKYLKTNFETLEVQDFTNIF